MTSPGLRESEQFPGVMIHETAWIDPDVYIGAGTVVWHFVHVMSGAHIGRDCVLGQNVMVGQHVRIGDRVRLQNNVAVYQGVELEDDVFCGPSAVFTNVKRPRSRIDRKDQFMPTIVRQGTSIGANATIVCGVELGQYSFVAAGALVSMDVAAHALVAGLPARRIGWVSRAGETLGADLRCPTDGSQYTVRDGLLCEVGDET